MINKFQFGHTEHVSSHIIFGGYALSKATQVEADQILDLLLKYSINHIDTAPMYGNSEKCIGSWMEEHRDKFFLATKSRKRSYDGAWKDLQNSLNRLRVNQIDLWQMHSLTNPQGWDKAIGPGGALEAFIEAREKGLVQYLGVTGHSNKTPAMHLRSLERFDFDTVMLSYNYTLMQKPRYVADFMKLISLCRERKVAIQTIKSIARRPWDNRIKTYNTYFYEPLESQKAIDKMVHWALGLQNSFLVTAGDMKLLPKILDAANRFKKKPSDEEMNAVIDDFDIQWIFDY
ncbi:MAG: aldo/keto reductase [Asgard group archaeon]|nr:aldo/keto reductase [Asgard group archaeon]